MYNYCPELSTKNPQKIYQLKSWSNNMNIYSYTLSWFLLWSLNVMMNASFFLSSLFPTKLVWFINSNNGQIYLKNHNIMESLSGTNMQHLAHTNYPSRDLIYLTSYILYDESKIDILNINTNINVGNYDKVVV